MPWLTRKTAMNPKFRPSQPATFGHNRPFAAPGKVGRERKFAGASRFSNRGALASRRFQYSEPKMTPAIAAVAALAGIPGLQSLVLARRALTEGQRNELDRLGPKIVEVDD